MQTHNYHLQAGWYHCAGAALDLISLQRGKIIMGSFVVARKSGQYLVGVVSPRKDIKLAEALRRAALRGNGSLIQLNCHLFCNFS